MKIENVKIVNHNNIVENADIIIEKKVIKQIIIKPGKGSVTLIPGFIETHIHGFGGYDAMDSAKSIEYMSQELAKVGVTTFIPTLMTAKWEQIISSMNNASKAKTILSKIGGLHLEGPFISVVKKGAHTPEYIIKASKSNIKELYKASNGKLIQVVIAPEENNLEIIKFATKLGIVVAIGHTNATAKETHDAISNGASAITHLWNAMSSVCNRSPGVVEAALNNDSVFVELICDLVHVDAEAIKLTIKSKGPEKVIIISDSIRPAGLPNGEYESGGVPVIKKDTKITLKSDGNIAGGAGSINVGYQTLVDLGYSMKDIVKMTSYNAAINHKWNQIGRIEVGCFADFVVLDKDKRIINTYINGELISK